MRLHGRACRLTIFIGETDQYRHKPLYSEIVHRAHARGLAGASVFRGIEGFGASSLIHTSRLLSMSEDLPVAIVIVDTEERVRAFLPQLDELVGERRDHRFSFPRQIAMFLSRDMTSSSLKQIADEFGGGRGHNHGDDGHARYCRHARLRLAE